MFTIYSPYVHYVFTIYSLYIHCMFTMWRSIKQACSKHILITVRRVDRCRMHLYVQSGCRVVFDPGPLAMSTIF